MGRDNVIVNRWFSQKERFADLMNGCLFQGQQVILPEQLEKIDRETDLFIPEKPGTEMIQGKGIQRYRDVAMRWEDRAELAILALENQERVHYAMPVRTMIYDGLSYAEQIEESWKNRKDTGDRTNRDEFLSHFRKTDKLCPVITLVFYYGSRPWDGSRDLHGMIFPEGAGCERENLRKYIPNYRINLVDAERLQDINVFQTDLQYVLNMIKYRQKKEKILEYVEANRSYFQRMNMDTYQALSVFLNSEKWLEGISVLEGKGEMDMCKALEDIYEDGKADGYKNGKEEGLTEKLREQVSKKLQKGKSLETIAEELEESVETISQLAKELLAAEAAAKENDL